jgi:hypothetical protein
MSSRAVKTSRCPARVDYAVGVETSDAGADVWVQRRPYRLSVVV